MTHDTTRSGQDAHDAKASKRGSDDADSLPEILEVFGAAPLVPAMGLDADDPDDDGEVLERDAQGRFISRDEGDDDLDADEDRSDDAPRAPSPWAATVRGPDRRAGDSDEVLEERLAGLADVCERLVDQLSLSEQRLAAIETSVDELARQTSFLPPKLRGLGSKVDDLTQGVGDERTRGLIEDVVAVLDLVDSARERFGDDPEPRRYLDALATRIGQILEGHKVTEIDTEGGFDPERHHAIERVPVDEPERDGQIVSVVRRGWSGGDKVVRYADVTVGSFDASRRDEPAEPSDAVEALDAAADEGPAASVDADGDAGADDESADVEPPALDARDESLPRFTADSAADLALDARDAVHGPTPDPSELDALSPPPGEAPKTVTDTDSASITFRPTQRRNRG